MTKSSAALLLWMSLVPGAAAAQAGTADALVARQKAMVAEAVRSECAGADADAIVVCGRRDGDAARHRFLQPGDPPLADARAPADQLTALEAGEDPCSTVGQNQRCSGGLPVFAIIGTIAQGIRTLSERGDE